MKTTSETSENSKKRQKCKWKRFKFPSRPEIWELFSEYLAYPPSVRSPRTQQEFARLNEVSEKTLSNYKKKADFWAKVAENKERMKGEIEDNLLLAKAIFKDIE